jgi:hypothetical protein
VGPGDGGRERLTVRGRRRERRRGKGVVVIWRELIGGGCEMLFAERFFEAVCVLSVPTGGGGGCQGPGGGEGDRLMISEKVGPEKDLRLELLYSCC